MESNTKKRVLERLWDNPERAFGIRFKRSGKFLTSLSSASDSAYKENGKVRLQWTADGEGVTVHYNGGSRESHLSVIDYLQEFHNIGQDFKSTLTELAKMYGVEITLSQEERTLLQRQQLAKEIFPFLSEALQNHKDGETYRYLKEVRQIEPDARYFGELTEAGIEAVKEGLKQRGFSYLWDDFTSLLHPSRVKYGYSCVIPNYTNGQITGFYLRDVTGSQNPKILASSGTGKAGYYDKLKVGEPAVLVEGQFDAIRLMQAGFGNVIAMTGSGLSDELMKMLQARDIRQITYIPDAEHNKDGSRRTSLADGVIGSLLKEKTDGKQHFDSVLIADISDEAMNGADKMDTDDYGRIHGAEALQRLVSGAKPWWAWRIARLKGMAGQMPAADYRREFRTIYGSCIPFDRELIRKAVDGREEFSQYGITPSSLKECDAEDNERDYSDIVKLAVSRFEKDTEGGMNREAVARLAEALGDAQAAGAREEWNGQMNQTWEDELQAISEQPETLKTKWKLGNVVKIGGRKTFLPSGHIEFYPADIELFCAFSSHGKTMFLMQAAIDMVRQNQGKTFLYVSCEENKRQLLERALNVFIDIPVADGGMDGSEYCFLPRTRKKAIKAAVKGEAEPLYQYRELYKYNTPTQNRKNAEEHFTELRKRIMEQVERYRREIYPFLKIVHTESSAESICANIHRFISESQGSDIGGIFIDYAQLLTSDKKSFNRTDELKDICKALKDLASSTELPIIIAAQLNRETMKKDIGFDGITMAQIGESADLERIAHDVFLIWQTNKTNVGNYMKGGEFNKSQLGIRSERIFMTVGGDTAKGDKGRTFLKTGFMYVEAMKARDGETDVWALMPFNGERGSIGDTDIDCMTDSVKGDLDRQFKLIGGNE